MHNMSPARLLCLVLTLAARGKDEDEKDRHFVLFPLGQGGQNQPILHLFKRAVGRFPKEKDRKEKDRHFVHAGSWQRTSEHLISPSRPLATWGVEIAEFPRFVENRLGGSGEGKRKIKWYLQR